MKHLIILVLFLLTSISLSHAQQQPRTWQIGFLAGPNYSYQRQGDNERPNELKTKNEAKFMGSGGLSLKYQLSKVFLTSNILFENKRSKTSTTFYNSNSSGSLGTTFSFNVSRHYITIPVLAGINIKKTGFFVNAGPYVGFLLKFKAENDDQTNTYFPNGRNKDYGISAGMGYSQTISPTLNLSTELRHSHSLFNSGTYGPGGKMGSTSLLLGVNFNLFKS